MRDGAARQCRVFIKIVSDERLTPPASRIQPAAREEWCRPAPTPVKKRPRKHDNSAGARRCFVYILLKIAHSSDYVADRAPRGPPQPEERARGSVAHGKQHARRHQDGACTRAGGVAEQQYTAEHPHGHCVPHVLGPQQAVQRALVLGCAVAGSASLRESGAAHVVGFGVRHRPLK